MKYTIIFSSEAIDTFESIKEQVRERWGNKTVVEFEKRTRQVLGVIETSPFVFQSISLNDNIRRGFIHRNCSMFYEVSETQIEILFFWDNRQDQYFKHQNIQKRVAFLLNPDNVGHCNNDRREVFSLTVTK